MEGYTVMLVLNLEVVMVKWFNKKFYMKLVLEREVVPIKLSKVSKFELVWRLVSV